MGAILAGSAYAKKLPLTLRSFGGQDVGQNGLPYEAREASVVWRLGQESNLRPAP